MAGKSGKSSIANFFVRKLKHEEIDLESDAAVTPVVTANIESVRVPVAIEADVTIVVDTPAITPASPVRNSTGTGDTPSTKAAKTVARTTPAKGKQRFPKACLTTYTWLSYDPIDDFMHCRLCKKQRGEGMWVTGKRNFRVKSVALHITSKVSNFFIQKSHLNKIDDEIVSVMAAVARSHGLNVCVDNLLPSMIP